MLEVVRSVVHEPKVLLLDEPTAVLDVPAAERLQTLIRQIRDEGCAIVYVSHRLEEVRRLADRLTVLRDGVIQGTHASMDWDVDHIVELMVGAPVDLEFPPRPVVAPEDRPPVFEVEGLEATGVGPVSITVGTWRDRRHRRRRGQRSATVAPRPRRRRSQGRLGASQRQGRSGKPERSLTRRRQLPERRQGRRVRLSLHDGRGQQHDPARRRARPGGAEPPLAEACRASARSSRTSAS